MQEEVNEKTIALYIKGGKITAQILKAALLKLLSKMEKKKQQAKGEKSQCEKSGKQSIENIPFLRPHKTLPLFTLLVVITRRE